MAGKLETSHMDFSIKENTQLHRFELPIGDDLFAAAYYRIENGQVALIHTEVPAEFSGRGIASQLAGELFELLRKTRRKAILKCPFMVRFLVKHPEYVDVVDG
jgi:uncharacterized protein